MSVKGSPIILAERVEIGERSKAGETDKTIALSLQRSISTIRKWRRRYEREGRAGLSSQMGRPATGALGQYPPLVAQVISETRKAHSGWGALTLLLELQKDTRFAGKKFPSRSRIAAYLKQEKLAKKHERRHELTEPKPAPITRAHQEWELDAQGKLAIAGLGSASIINIVDVFSHLKIDGLPCLRTTHANTQDYQFVLRRSFVRYGKPEQISFDHDSVFYDNQTASPFPTQLHLWLIGLGIEVRFIHKLPPLEHAMIERNHQTITQQAVEGQTFANWTEMQNMLTGRIHFLNTEYPSSSSHGLPPLVAHPQAAQTQRPYRLEWEKEDLDMQRVFDYLSKERWFRLTSSVGMFSLGAQRYNAGMKFSKQTLEITFDAQTRELVCLPEKGASFRLAVRGLTKEALIGELDPLTTIPNYQLALPFSRQAWREAALLQDLSDTTL